MPSSPPTRRNDPQRKMQRLRVGVTGLAFVVVLLVVFFAVMTGLQRNAADGNAAAMTNATSNETEPLAQLGVAPNGAPDNAATKPPR